MSTNDCLWNDKGNKSIITVKTVTVQGFELRSPWLMLVVYEYNLRSHNMKHLMSSVKDNTVLYLLFYKHG